jgi:AraC family transcriptional regulator
MKSEKNILNAIDFMEQNLKNKLTSEQISFHSTYSVFHFSRVFIELTGMSPGEYLRRRRLTLAAKDILIDGKGILYTAFEYQFQTQEGFTRAFRDYFGITPGRCRQLSKNISGRFMEPFSEATVSQKRKNENMKPEIKELGELKFIGIPIFTDNKKDIRDAWDILMRYEHKITNRTGSGIRAGICAGLEFYTEDFFEKGKFFYMPAIQVDSLESIPLEMTAKIIPPSKYAVFTHKGIAHTVSETITSAYDSWLTEAGLETDRCFDFEYYDDRFIPDSEDSVIDVYIPVK